MLVPAHPALPEPSVRKVRKKAENPWRKRDAEGPLGGKAQRQFCVLSFQHRGGAPGTKGSEKLTTMWERVGGWAYTRGKATLSTGAGGCTEQTEASTARGRP